MGMKFAHIVKHNGIEYLPGEVVPIGIDPVKEIFLEDMTASELSVYLEENYDIVIPYQKGKKTLLTAIKEAEEGPAKEGEEDEIPNSNEGSKSNSGEGDSDPEDNDNEEDSEEDSEEDLKDGEDEEDEEDPQDPIIDQDPITGEGEQSEFVKSLLENPDTDTEE